MFFNIFLKIVNGLEAISSSMSFILRDVYIVLLATESKVD